MEKQAKRRSQLWIRTWPKTIWRKPERRTAGLEQLDVIDALAKMEEQEQKQEFFHLTARIREFGVKEAEVADRLTELLETKREWALYEALMGVLRQNRPQSYH